MHLMCNRTRAPLLMNGLHVFVSLDTSILKADVWTCFIILLEIYLRTVDDYLINNFRGTVITVFCC